jgi:hypothetical protein
MASKQPSFQAKMLAALSLCAPRPDRPLPVENQAKGLALTAPRPSPQRRAGTWPPDAVGGLMTSGNG